MKYVPSVHLFHTLRIHLPDSFEREIQLANLRQKLKSQKKRASCSGSCNFRTKLHNDRTSDFRMTGFGTEQRGCSIFNGVGSTYVRVEQQKLLIQNTQELVCYAWWVQRTISGGTWLDPSGQKQDQCTASG